MTIELPIYEQAIRDHWIRPESCQPFVFTAEAEIADGWLKRMIDGGLPVPVRAPFDDRTFIEIAIRGVDKHVGATVITHDLAIDVRDESRGRMRVANLQLFFPGVYPANSAMLRIGLEDDWTVLPGQSFTWVESFATHADEETRANCEDYARLALLCIALTHVRNIAIESSPLSRPMRRRLSRAGVRDAESIRVRTLRITPFSTRQAEHSRRGGDPTPVPFHLVRGHFSTYTDERKLFGKYTGTFWIPAHARGSAEFGRVDHRYVVQPFDDTTA
jgi:hypothetical protein